MSANARPLSARQRAPVAKSNVNTTDLRQDRPHSAAATRSSPATNSPRSCSSTPRNRGGLPVCPTVGPTHVESKTCLEPTLPWTVPSPRYPPVLAPSRFSTVPLPEETPKNRYKRPPICPQKWLDAQQSGSSTSATLSHLDLTDLVDPNVKKRLIREFIEKNRDRLPRFNSQYAKLDHNEVYRMMMKEENIAALLLRYELREQKLNASSSRFVKASLNDDGYNSLGEIKNDPFLMSLNTSRRTRQERLSQLFTPNALKDQAETKFRRGYNHAPEYGNFSRYNGLMVLNNCKFH